MYTARINSGLTYKQSGPTFGFNGALRFELRELASLGEQSLAPQSSPRLPRGSVAKIPNLSVSLSPLEGNSNPPYKQSGPTFGFNGALCLELRVPAPPAGQSLVDNRLCRSRYEQRNITRIGYSIHQQEVLDFAAYSTNMIPMFEKQLPVMSVAALPDATCLTR